MRSETVFDHLLRGVEEQRKIVVDSVLTGNISEQEYRRLVGVIQGLDFSTHLIKDLASKLETDDE